MLNRMIIWSATFLLVATTVMAQQPTTTTSEPRKPSSAQQPKSAEDRKEAEIPIPEPPSQPVNIRIEVAITDQVGPGQPAKKIVSMVTSDRQNNSIRSTANVRVSTSPAPGAVTTYRYQTVNLNVDARPVLLKDNKVSLNFGLEYQPKVPGGGSSTAEQEAEPGMSSLNERLGLILESGKAVVVSQAADPVSDRRITVEVTATILK
jgi:hypothetical protein